MKRTARWSIAGNYRGIDICLLHQPATARSLLPAPRRRTDSEYAEYEASRHQCFCWLVGMLWVGMLWFLRLFGLSTEITELNALGGEPPLMTSTACYVLRHEMLNAGSMLKNSICERERIYSHCRYTLRLLLYICDLVKLHVAFFFYVLPFMVNKDEYNT